MNVRSLGKLSGDLEFLVFVLEELPHVSCLGETWLSNSDDTDSMLVPGYTQYATLN